MEIVTAKRDHVGTVEIIEHIGSASGIDNAIYTSNDIATAQKVISLARYLLATNGQSPGRDIHYKRNKLDISTWAYILRRLLPKMVIIPSRTLQSYSL